MSEAQTGGVQKFEKLSGPDDPNRCQSVLMNQQCMWKAVAGTIYCPRHGGTKPGVAQAKENFRNLKLVQWGERVKEFGENPEVKSLRDEIGVLRLILENIVNKCTNTNELIFHNGKISELIMKIEKIVTSAHKLETSMGMMLDKTSIIKIAQGIAEIISAHIEDADTLDLVNTQIVDLILNNAEKPKEIQ